MSPDDKEPVNTCDICGAPDAILRTYTNDEGIIIDELSGFTCQKCFDREEDYYGKLAEKFKRNPKLRDRLAKRFQKIRMENNADFICEYGPGVKHEKCEICGQGNSYLCIVEDHFEDHIEMWDEIAGWFCADCINTGIQQTYIRKAICEIIQFRKECEDVKARYTTYMTTSCYTNEAAKQKALRNFKSALKQGTELEKQESVYKRKAKRMEKARRAYEGIPVKVVVRTAREGDLCFLCEKIIGKDHKCGDD